MFEQVWECYQTLEDLGGELIFNITSGYKGMIPIACNIQLLLTPHIRATSRAITTKMRYLYQDSSTLIRLPSIPVQLDWGIVKGDILKEADTLEGVDANKIDLRTARALFMQLKDQRMQLSPLGKVFWTLKKLNHLQHHLVPIEG